MIKNFCSQFQRYARDEKGSLSVIFGAAVTTIVFSSAVALDYSSLSSEQTKMRSALDAAVIVATKARSDGNPNWRKLGEDVMAGNYPKDTAIKPVLTVDGEAVRGSVSRDVPLKFGSLIGMKAVKVAANSAATVKRAQANACILALNPTAGVSMSGTTEIQSNCGLHSNGASAGNFNMSISAKITTNSNTGVGGANMSGQATITPPLKTNSEFLPDPLASVPEPIASGTCRNVDLSGTNTVSFPPGRYCYFSVSGMTTITLEPGIHTFETSMNMSGTYNVRGDGVVVHFANGGGANWSGGGSLDLKAMTSGPYAGIAIFQARSNTNQLSISGFSSIRVNGAIYAPGASFSASGAGSGAGEITSDIAIIVNDLNYSGAAKLRIKRDIGACGSSSILPAAVMTMCKGNSDGGVRLIN